jgi:hypothetical protein
MLAIVSILSFSVLGGGAPDAFQMFIERTVMNQQGFDFGYDGNQSLRGAIARFESPLGPGYVPFGDAEAERRRPTTPLTMVLGLLLLAVAAFASRSAPDEIGGAAPFVCLLVILSPLSWKAHFVVLLLPAAFLIAQVWQAKKKPVDGGRDQKESRSMVPKSFAAVSIVFAFVLFNLTSPRVIGLVAAEFADAHSLIFAGSMILFAASCVRPAQPPPGVGQKNPRLLI